MKPAQERKLEVSGFESCMFGDSGKHFGADFDRIVERPSVFALRGMAELNVGAARTPFQGPSDS
jgi:hypothetical protein